MTAETDGRKMIARNKKAFHDFHILETIECGLVLQGTEVKSLRAGGVNFSDAHARILEGKAVLLGLDIAPYAQGNIMNHEPKRPRTLLLHKREILKLMGKTQQKGLTLVPLSLYFRRGYAKIELGLAQGKKLHDKRDDMKKKDAMRDVARAMGRKGGSR